MILFSGRHIQARLFPEKSTELIGVFCHFPAVDPEQIGCFSTDGGYIFNLAVNVLFRPLSILPQISIQFIKPLSAVHKCSGRSYSSKHIGLRCFICVETPVDLMADRLVRHDHGRRLYACNVKCFRRGDTGNTVHPAVFRDRGIRHIFHPRFYDITVYLIGEDKHVMLYAQISNPLQRLPVPDSSRRILRIAQKEQ